MDQKSYNNPMNKTLIALLVLSLMIMTSCAPPEGSSVVSQTQTATGKDSVLTEKDEVLKSHMNRVRSIDVKSQAEIREETQTISQRYLPDGYFEVPSALTSEAAAGKVDINDFNTECGNMDVDKTTLGDRIANCKQIYAAIGVNSSWATSIFGVSGEGNWSLVAVSINTDSKSLVWYDFTTKLLWSDYIDTANFENAATKLARTCAVFEDKNDHSLNSNSVVWRLPTRSDFLQADINGARYVLNNLNKEYWTSTMITSDTAWSINQSTGNSTSTAILSDTTKAVRCVGIALE